MNENIHDLLHLIAENPDLPIVPIVDSEIVADDGYNSWIGGWGSAHVGEYYYGEERYFFKDESDPGEIDDTLTDAHGYDFTIGKTDEELKAAYLALPWVKAIFVNITLPEH